MATNLDIDASVALYRRRLGPNGRYASFDYCYNYFQTFRELGHTPWLFRTSPAERPQLHPGDRAHRDDVA